MTNDDIYLIWSHEHGAWWAPGEQGYVTAYTKAGHYTRDRALAICTRAMFRTTFYQAPNEIPVRLKDFKDAVQNFRSIAEFPNDG